MSDEKIIIVLVQTDAARIKEKILCARIAQKNYLRAYFDLSEKINFSVYLFDIRIKKTENVLVNF